MITWSALTLRENDGNIRETNSSALWLIFCILYKEIKKEIPTTFAAGNTTSFII